ncbi:MAG: glycosyltransferase family 87 protein [Paludisphaera borealis]|uniref:glycosyltransferase family 87 protein n=1 Tax=Paludisphaera borealis TaxID=1387353 RepID=UPI002842794A|nr:glycosyltransferase family 87 protein [Paludisphaera borealis]MDR3618285.1 glycosyltransferase family 87 protein [Paludisphaera borealis]
MTPMDTPDAGADLDRSSRLRRDQVDGDAVDAASRRLQPWLLGLLGVLMVVFSAPPLVNVVRGWPNKDYGLWYQVGAALRQGYDIYPDPTSGRLFPFMYPPSAAALLGYVSFVGESGTIALLTLAHSIAWLGAILLSVRLATGGKASGRNPLLYVVPSLCIVALIHNSYMLGQPNMALLTLLLAAFYCLQKGRDGWAGALVATSAAIKAFPILALGYFIYRRKWRASAATVAALAAWLLIVPLPFRTPSQAVRDVKVWTGGMLFTYNSQGIAQRPFRSYSYKNQSIMALAHRFLRDVPADGEAVLSRRTNNFRKERAQMGLHADGSIDLTTILTAPARPANLDKLFEGAADDLKKAWRVNVASLDFRTVTLVTLSAMLGLSLFVVVAMPPARRRTARTDALEFALITLLIVMFSPLSFNYAFVWLIYPITVALNEVLEHPAPAGRRRTLQRAWLATILLIPALAIPMPLYAQAWGNLFVPALLLVLSLGWTLLRVSRTEIDQHGETSLQRHAKPHAAGASALLPQAD